MRNNEGHEEDVNEVKRTTQRWRCLDGNCRGAAHGGIDDALRGVPRNGWSQNSGGWVSIHISILKTRSVISIYK